MVSPGVMPSLPGSYEIMSLLGTGGMGSVFKARQLSTGRIVALKTLQDSDSPNAVRRFQREAKMLATLKHPNIVEAWTFGLTEDRQAYLTMEYLEGVSLAEVLKRDGPLPLERFLNVFLQVISGLKHAHQHGVIHRDLKPENIMLITAANGAESVKLVDFGIARSEKLTSSPNKLTQNGAILGTLNYMSPEQFKGGALDACSDIYSLGCVMHEALIGTPPYQISTPAEAMVHSADTADFVPNLVARGVPAWLDRMIEICLSREPQFRYQTTALLEADFAAKQILDNNNNNNNAKSALAKDSSRTKRGIKLLIPALIVFALLASAGLGLSLKLNLVAPITPLVKASPTDLIRNFEAEFTDGTSALDAHDLASAAKHFRAAKLIEAQLDPTGHVLERVASRETTAGRMALKRDYYDLAFEMFKKAHPHYLKCEKFDLASGTAINASEAVRKLGPKATPAAFQAALLMCNAVESKQPTTRRAIELSVAQGRLLAQLGKQQDARAKLEQALSQVKLVEKDDPDLDLLKAPTAEAEDDLAILLSATNPALAARHFDKATELYVSLAKQNIRGSAGYENAIRAQIGKSLLKGQNAADTLKTKQFLVELSEKAAHQRLPSFQYSLASSYLERGNADAAIPLARQIVTKSKSYLYQRGEISQYLLFRTWLLLSNAYIIQRDKDKAADAVHWAFYELGRCREADVRDSILVSSTSSAVNYLCGRWKQSAVNAQRAIEETKTTDWNAPLAHPNIYGNIEPQALNLRLNLQLGRAEFKAGNYSAAVAALTKVENLPGGELSEKLKARSLMKVIRRIATKNGKKLVGTSKSHPSFN